MFAENSILEEEEEEEEEKAEAERNIIRQGRTSWSESTPQGKLLRGGRGKYVG